MPEVDPFAATFHFVKDVTVQKDGRISLKGAGKPEHTRYSVTVVEESGVILLTPVVKT